MIAAILSGLYQRESHSTCSSIIATQGPGTNSWAKSLLMSTSLRKIGPQISWKNLYKFLLRGGSDGSSK